MMGTVKAIPVCPDCGADMTILVQGPVLIAICIECNRRVLDDGGL